MINDTFSEHPVQVTVVDCPDLTQHGLPAPGLGGETKLVEGGGEPFNHDTDYNRSHYNRYWVTSDECKLYHQGCPL